MCWVADDDVHWAPERAKNCEVKIRWRYNFMCCKKIMDNGQCIIMVYQLMVGVLAEKRRR